MILEFLDDLLGCIDNEVMKDFQDLEMKYKRI